MASSPGPRQRPRPLLRTTIGEVLRRVRRAQGRTLADVSRAARVSVPYLSELERGRKEASSEVLAAICDALRIDLPELLAVVGRELAGERTATVIRLDSVRGGAVANPAANPVASPAPRPSRGGDVVCLAA
jgi:transcriptional regulator with XRE-family HTH domain